MKLRLFMLLAVVAALIPASVQASDVKVIANPSVGATEISGDELKNVFLRSKSALADGSHVEPVLAKGGPTHSAFLRQYIGKTEEALDTYYRSLVFTGKGMMPKVLASDTDIIAYVAKNKGAIGYISAATAVQGAKILTVK